MRSLLFLISIAILFSVQTSLLHYFSIFGVVPDLALILSVYCAFSCNQSTGILAGFTLGFSEDCLSGGILGAHTLSKSLIAGFIALIKNNIVISGTLPILIIIFIASLVDGIIFVSFSFMLSKEGVTSDLGSMNLIVYATYNAVLGPMLFSLFEKYENWVQKILPVKQEGAF